MRVSFPVAAATACMYERKERSRRDAARQLQPAARADAQRLSVPAWLQCSRAWYRYRVSVRRRVSVEQQGTNKIEAVDCAMQTVYPTTCPLALTTMLQGRQDPQTLR